MWPGRMSDPWPEHAMPAGLFVIPLNWQLYSQRMAHSRYLCLESVSDVWDV